jgi:putative ABC transport system ATP-binding protein
MPMAASGAVEQAREPALIRVCDLGKTYQTPAGDFVALRGINAEIRAGEFVGIIGRSGAGKSTLVNMITGVDQVSVGEIWVDGTPVHALDEDAMSFWRGRHIGVVYQSFELLSTLSLLDNVMLPMDFCGLYHPKRSRERARSLLAQVGLEEHMDKTPTRISGGQQQRVAIARALANDPPIIVADEPTGNLDSSTADEIFGLFEALVAQGQTIVMVTHDSGLARRFSRVMHLVDGVLVKDGSS